MDHGAMIISLDCELYWGIHDVMDIADYQNNLLGVRQVVPRMLDLFKSLDIHVTWATVGFLFYSDKQKLLANLPDKKPGYSDKGLSPYPKIKNIGEGETTDPFHYASSLIDIIKKVPFQEIGTHTFSHYYCLEEGQNGDDFEADLKAAVHAGVHKDVNIKSIVFPRNQINEQYLHICQKHGLSTYRGNEQSFLYNPDCHKKNQSVYKRALRLLDTYINITGDHIYSLEEKHQLSVINLPSSKFLRPYNHHLRWAEPLKLNRIKKSMTKAAKEKKIYHLWWHPHNFGIHIEENCRLLKNILEHFKELQHKYGMQSMNMGEVGSFINDAHNKSDGELLQNTHVKKNYII